FERVERLVRVELVSQVGGSFGDLPQVRIQRLQSLLLVLVALSGGSSLGDLPPRVVVVATQCYGLPCQPGEGFGPLRANQVTGVVTGSAGDTHELADLGECCPPHLLGHGGGLSSPD